MNELLQNLEKLHTTPLGAQRIQKNARTGQADPVNWCKEKILQSGAVLTRAGKNWYVEADGWRITVNAHSYTVITVHQSRG